MKATQNYDESMVLTEDIINKLKLEASGNLVLTKKEVTVLAKKVWLFLSKKNKTDKFSEVFIQKAMIKNNDYLNIIKILNEMIPALVYKVVQRFENGHLASIFSSDEMTALAHQKILDVLAKYREGHVDMKGLRSYFKTAFKNHCQKTYEAHSGTDIRGSIRTVGSDEAMNIAINKNHYNPEKQYIIDNAMKAIYKELMKADIEYNKKLSLYNSAMNLQEQHFYQIIKGLLEGNTAEETCDQIKMLMPEYLRQKRLALQHLKRTMSDLLKDLQSEFESEVDNRIHAQTVEKRSRKASPENKTAVYLFTKEVALDKRRTEVSLEVCIKVVDRAGNPIYPPKASELSNTETHILETAITTKNKLSDVKNNLLQKGKSAENLKVIEELSVNFFNNFQKQLLNFQKNRYKGAG